MDEMELNLLGKIINEHLKGIAKEAYDIMPNGYTLDISASIEYTVSLSADAKYSFNAAYKKKMFRLHRGLLDDSIKTCVNVNSLEDIRCILNDNFPDSFLRNICIDNRSIDDSMKLGQDWKYTRYVLADFGDHKRQCLGMCNFYEE